MRRWLPFYVMLTVVIALVLFSLQMVFAQTDPNAPPPGQTIQLQRNDTLDGLATRFNKSVACLQRANKMAPDNFSLTGFTTILIPDNCDAVLTAATPTPESANSLTTATFTPVGSSGTPLPSTATPPPTPAPTAADQTYTVVYGDRLAKIAENFGLTVDCIARTNTIANPDLIYVGQQLRISANCNGSGGGAVSNIPGSTGSNPRACQFDRNPGRVAPNGQYVVQVGDALDFIACDFGIELKCLKDSNPQLGGVSLLMPGDTLTIDRSCPVWRDSTLPIQ